MFLARVVAGSSPQVYPLIGELYFPRAWRFMSYQRGAAAVAETQVKAIVAARMEFGRKLLKSEATACVLKTRP